MPGGRVGSSSADFCRCRGGADRVSPLRREHREAASRTAPHGTAPRVFALGAARGRVRVTRTGTVSAARRGGGRGGRCPLPGGRWAFSSPARRKEIAKRPERGAGEAADKSEPRPRGDERRLREPPRPPRTKSSSNINEAPQPGGSHVRYAARSSSGPLTASAPPPGCSPGTEGGSARGGGSTASPLDLHLKSAAKGAEGWGGRGLSRDSALWQSAWGGTRERRGPSPAPSHPGPTRAAGPFFRAFGGSPRGHRRCPRTPPPGPEPPRVSEGGAAAAPPPPPSRLRKRSVRRGQRGICIAQMAARRFKAAPPPHAAAGGVGGWLRGDAAVTARSVTTRHSQKCPRGGCSRGVVYRRTAGPRDSPDTGTPLTPRAAPGRVIPQRRVSSWHSNHPLTQRHPRHKDIPEPGTPPDIGTPNIGSVLTPGTPPDHGECPPALAQ
ncbi:basic salivary proline-rich protein 1-like [Cyrtonyx montezumae]|uniref:basic salivary proline-rich protein 1-like n=1 Tax=Cyrtonyx montezumae TaxID=9017 RepID=UPI0032DBAF42